MSAEVQTMFSVREVPWHGLGTIVADAPNSAEAIGLAGLDWTVEGKPVFDADGKQINGFAANTRKDDGTVFGIVTNRYRIVQNAEAFAFTDELIGGNVRYETAGSLKGGRVVWMLARLPETKVAGDETIPYLCFCNSHDGTGSVKVCMTPIRVVCNNTLNLALRTAKRQWSTIHAGKIEQKKMEARHALELAEKYMFELDVYADRLANTSLPVFYLQDMLTEIFPVSNNATDLVKDRVFDLRDEYLNCYYRADNDKFRGTAWGALNAMTDFVGHRAPQRRTGDYQENRWGKIMGGHDLLDKFADMVLEHTEAA